LKGGGKKRTGGGRYPKEKRGGKKKIQAPLKVNIRKERRNVLRGKGWEKKTEDPSSR